MLRHLSRITGAIKYAHSEVGFIESMASDEPQLAGRRAEQHEIEFHSHPIEEMGDFMSIAHWIIRKIAYRHGIIATFAPKIANWCPGQGYVCRVARHTERRR